MEPTCSTALAGIVSEFCAIGAKGCDVLLTVGDFCAALFWFCFVMHVYFLIGTMGEWETLLMWFVGLMTTNTLLIPIWHFFQFDYFREKFFPWQSVWELFAMFKTDYGTAHWGLPLKDPQKQGQYKHPVELEKYTHSPRIICPFIKTVLFITWLVVIIRVALGCGGKGTVNLFDWIMCITMVGIPISKYILLFIGYICHFWVSLSSSARAKFQKAFRRAMCQHTKGNTTYRDIYDIKEETDDIIRQTAGLEDDVEKTEWGPAPIKHEPGEDPDGVIETNTLRYIPDPFVFSIYGHKRLFVCPCKCICSQGNADQFIKQGKRVKEQLAEEGGREIDVDKLDNPEPQTIHAIMSGLMEVLHLVAALLGCILIPFFTGYDWWICLLIALPYSLVFMPLFYMQFPGFTLGYIFKRGFFCGCGIREKISVREEYVREKSGDFDSILTTRKEYRGLRIISVVTYLFVIVIFLAVSIAIVSHKDKSKQFAYEDPQYHYKLPDFEPRKYEEKAMLDVVSDICYADPYGLTMLQVEALTSASYYDATKKTTFRFLREFFDTRTKEEIEAEDNHDECEQCHDITNHRYQPYDPVCQKCYRNAGMPLVRQVSAESTNSHGTAMIFAFADKNLTVFSIRGSTTGRDWALDVQFFASSLLLEIAWPIQILTSTVTRVCNEAIKWLLKLPLLLFQKATLVDKYYNKLKDGFSNVMEDEDMNLPNHLYVGHSLGGGLAKLFALNFDREAVALSGPGVSLFADIYDTTPHPQRELLVQADIIPDMDLVPRVEQSAGTRYRIPCRSGAGDCHSCVRSICMTSIMCNTEHVGYCTKAMGEAEYQEMVNLARNS